MLSLLALIHCVAAISTATHDTATVTAASILQLPLNMLHHDAHNTSTANFCTTTQLLRSKQLKSDPKADMLVSLDAP